MLNALVWMFSATICVCAWMLMMHIVEMREQRRDAEAWQAWHEWHAQHAEDDTAEM